MSSQARNGINKVRLIITVALIAMLVVGCVWAGKDIIESRNRQKTMSDLQNMYPGSSSAATGSEANGESSESEEQTSLNAAGAVAHASLSTRESKKMSQMRLSPKRKSASYDNDEHPVCVDGRPMQYDFFELYHYNKDIVGWITVGNYLSMPVVYRDNEFYLKHDYYGNPDKAGTLFINEANTIWPADANLLFHGHNMRDGSVFGDLDDYRTAEYLRDNVIVTFRTIYDETEKYYVIFSLFDASMAIGNGNYFDVGYINFDDSDEFKMYTDQLQRRNYFNMPFDVREGDHMLTLLTCSYSNDNGRFMLFCRELREDETVEGILEAAKSITKKSGY